MTNRVMQNLKPDKGSAAVLGGVEAAGGDVIGLTLLFIPGKAEVDLKFQLHPRARRLMISRHKPRSCKMYSREYRIASLS